MGTKWSNFENRIRSKIVKHLRAAIIIVPNQHSPIQLDYLTEYERNFYLPKLKKKYEQTKDLLNK